MVVGIAWSWDSEERSGLSAKLRSVWPEIADTLYAPNRHNLALPPAAGQAAGQVAGQGRTGQEEEEEEAIVPFTGA